MVLVVAVGATAGTNSRVRVTRQVQPVVAGRIDERERPTSEAVGRRVRHIRSPMSDDVGMRGVEIVDPPGVRGMAECTKMRFAPEVRYRLGVEVDVLQPSRAPQRRCCRRLRVVEVPAAILLPDGEVEDASRRHVGRGTHRRFASHTRAYDSLMEVHLVRIARSDHANVRYLR